MTIRPAARRAAPPAALLLSVLLATACSHDEPAAAPLEALSGQVYSTDADGVPAVGDRYEQACDVYLVGGPLDGVVDPGLPLGEYYFQVTDETGTLLLSHEGPQNGLIRVTAEEQGSDGAFREYEGQHQTISNSSEDGLRVRLCPLAMPSPDGLYKAWVTPREDFEAGEGAFGFREERSLTHVFAVTSKAGTSTDLVIRRFCDRDADGSAEGEEFLDGVRFMVSVDTLDGGQPFEVSTGASMPGEARVAGIPLPASYSVCELVPGTGVPGSWWYGTLPVFAATSGSSGSACYVGLLEGGEETTLLFGAACVLQATGGQIGSDFLGGTGQALLQDHDPAWRQLLDGAGLVTADGSPYLVTGGSFHAAFFGFSDWMAGAGTVNEAHLLSREVAATLLAAEYGELDMTARHVLRPSGAACYGAHTASPEELVALAQSLIQADGFTPPGDPNAAPQRCVRSALAGMNTNASPILVDGCCDTVYP